MVMQSFRTAISWTMVAVLCIAAPVAAQSRIAILDATGITVLDTTTGQVRARFELSLPPEEYPGGINATADGARLLVTTSWGTTSRYEKRKGALYVLDAVTGERLARVSTPPSSRKPLVLPDGSRAFLVSEDTVFEGTLYGDRASIITSVDLSAFTVHSYSWGDLVSCYAGDFLAMHPDGGMLYLHCNFGTRITVRAISSLPM